MNTSPLSPIYETQRSTTMEDEDWDRFVETCPGGHHAQTAMWAKVKRLLGWSPIRVVARSAGEIVGGVQILMRHMPLVGRMGYVVKGPLFARNDAQLEDHIMNEIQLCCQTHHIQYLTIQPPNDRSDFSAKMEGWGYRKSLVSFPPAPSTTLVIDLSQELDAILAGMRSTTRYNIRLAGRKGVTVREASRQELGIFHETLLATSDRKNIKEYPLQYWETFYDAFAPRGLSQIFFSEYQGEIISSLLLVSFGDTVLYKKGGWMGIHKNLHANDLLQWEAIRWSKQRGYRYYDFEGISPDAAKSIAETGRIAETNEGTVASFKFGFGGQVTFYPEAYDQFFNPVLSWGYWNVFRRIRFRDDVNYVINSLIRS